MESVISTSLCQAAREGLYSEVQRLLEIGHHVHNADNRGYTALHEAVQTGHEDCAQLLLQQEGCDPNARTHEGYSPTYLVCKYRSEPSLISLLVHHGADCNVGDNEEITPLHLACELNKVELVCRLLDCEADTNSRDFNGFTPLHTAISQRHLVVVKKLLERGASVHDRDHFGRTALFLAAQEGWPECTNLLIEKGASVNSRTEDGTTPLMVAATSQSEEEVKLLLEHGANPNMECSSRQMALNLAVHTGKSSLVKLLLEKTGREVIAVNSAWAPDETVSLPGLAIDTGSLECLAMILDCQLGPIVNQAPLPVSFAVRSIWPYKKMSPLCFLLESRINQPNAVQMMELLLDNGAAVNATVIDDMPPLVGLVLSEPLPVGEDYETFQQTKLHCFRVLLEHGCNIDYSSCDLGFPDAVLAGCIFNRSTVNKSLLRLLMESSVSCNTDGILDYLKIHPHRISVWVVQALMEYGTMPRDLIEYPNIVVQLKPTSQVEVNRYRQLLDSRPTGSLQALSRIVVRQWLWSNAGSSARVKAILDALNVPVPVQKYIAGSAFLSCSQPPA